jgi:hypothetical protein
MTTSRYCNYNCSPSHQYNCVFLFMTAARTLGWTNWILQHRQVTPDGCQQSANVPLQGMDASQPNTLDHPQEGMPTARYSLYRKCAGSVYSHSHSQKKHSLYTKCAGSVYSHSHSQKPRNICREGKTCCR